MENDKKQKRVFTLPSDCLDYLVSRSEIPRRYTGHAGFPEMVRIVFYSLIWIHISLMLGNKDSPDNK